MSIRTATSSGVFTIEMARPEKKNALTLEMYATMTDALLSAAADSSVRAILIAGQPGIFTAGNDLDDFANRPPTGMDSPVARFMTTLVATEKPVVAAVTGAAIGIGATMLLHCDLVYVSDEARLAMPFTSLGLVAEFASSLIVPRLMGHARAAEKLLLGDPFTGSDAVECGIANAVLPPDAVVHHARRMAERFNTLPPEAVRETKRLLRCWDKDAIQRAMTTEAAVFASRVGSPEAKEAFQAFFQRRSPDFSKLD